MTLYTPVQILMLINIYSFLIIGALYSSLAMGSYTSQSLPITGSDICPETGRPFSEIERTARGVILASSQVVTTGLIDPYFDASLIPRQCWVKNFWIRLNDVEACSHSNYRNLSFIQRVRHARDSFLLLNQAHGLNYNPNALLCVVNRESKFYPAAHGASSDRGLGQVIRITAQDAFLRFIRGPNSPDTTETRNMLSIRTQGFQDFNGRTDACRNGSESRERRCLMALGEEFHNKMIASPLAQMDLTMIVFHSKLLDIRRRGGAATLESVLQNYNGNNTRPSGSRSSYKEIYSARVNNCTACLDRLGDVTSDSGRLQNCLDLAKGEEMPRERRRGNLYQSGRAASPTRIQAPRSSNPPARPQTPRVSPPRDSSRGVRTPGPRREAPRNSHPSRSRRR